MPLLAFPAKNADIRQANADIRQANSDISPGAAVTEAVNLVALNMKEPHLALLVVRLAARSPDEEVLPAASTLCKPRASGAFQGPGVGVGSV